MNPAAAPWIVFGVLVVGSLAVDLGLFQKKAHRVAPKEALLWSLVWIGLAGAFNLGVWHWKGPVPATEFLAGYLVEKSLSVDNLFVFVAVFSFLKIPREMESRILLWGIFGALVMRAAFIAGGIALIQAFSWMTYVFGGILIVTALKMLRKDEGADPSRNFFVRLITRFVPSTPELDGQRFFTVKDGRRLATPLFICVIIIEFTDVLFAVDSIPAVLAITTDPFVVYTSNVFAILGLRALYFLLAEMMGLFRFLKLALVLILGFVGAKMILAHHVKVPIPLSLGVIGGILLVAVLASLALRKPEPPPPSPAP